MSNLLELISRGGSFFVFALLELLCFYFIVNFNSPQRAIWVETGSLYTNAVMSRYDRLLDYLSLYDQIDQIKQENASLRSQLPSASYVDQVEQDSIVDDSLRQRYTFTAVNIINKSPYGPNNSFVVDKGSDLQFAAGQGVIGPQGIVGIITATSPLHARVMTLLHRDTRVSAGLRKEPFFGSLTWDGADPRVMTLSAIPNYATVSVGDTVETTGYSNVFPTGLTIGTVDEVRRDESGGNQLIRVKLINDLLQLQHAYIVTDLLKEDLIKLNLADEQ